jgi:hypothetical protein
LVFTTPPSGATAGSAFTGQPVVKTQDAYGNNSTVGLGASKTMTIAIKTGTGTLQGTTSYDIGTSAGNGTITGSGLRIDQAGGFTLSATAASGLTEGDSSAFTVAAAAAAQLAFVGQPATAAEGVSLGTVTVQLKDQFGNSVSQSGVSVALAIGNNPGLGLGILTATTPATTSSGGLATFSGPSINNSGVGYTLSASSSGLTSATSSAFNITGGRFSVATGNWSSTATWSRTSGVGSGAPVPTAADAVTIERGYTVTVDVTGAACASLQVGSSAAVNSASILTFSGATPSLTVSGAVALGGSGNSARTGTITFTSGSTLTAGSLQLGSSLTTPAAGTITMTAGGTLSLGGAITIGTASGTWTPGTGMVERRRLASALALLFWPTAP